MKVYKPTSNLNRKHGFGENGCLIKWLCYEE